VVGYARGGECSCRMQDGENIGTDAIKLGESGAGRLDDTLDHKYSYMAEWLQTTLHCAETLYRADEAAYNTAVDKVRAASTPSTTCTVSHSHTTGVRVHCCVSLNVCARCIRELVDSTMHTSIRASINPIHLLYMHTQAGALIPRTQYC
jgi:hypothetical protein